MIKVINFNNKNIHYLVKYFLELKANFIFIVVVVIIIKI